MGLIKSPAGRVRAVGLLLVMFTAVAGCGRGAAYVVLPKKPTAAGLAGVPVASPTARQLVVAAYEGYWQATKEALDSRSAARARTILSGYIPKSAVPALVKGMRAMWRRGELAFGSPVFHIMSVKITGHRTAAVHDCIDLSHVGFQNQRSGQIVGGLGQSHDYLITTLVLTHGRWLVTGAIPVVRTCAF